MLDCWLHAYHLNPKWKLVRLTMWWQCGEGLFSSVNELKHLSEVLGTDTGDLFNNI